MVSCIVLVLWISSLTQVCRGEELSRDVVLAWFRLKVLDGLGLQEAPRTRLEGPGGEVRAAPRGARISRTTEEKQHAQSKKDVSQIILFPTSDSSCATSETSSCHFMFHFQPSINTQDVALASAQFWFYAGEEDASSNSSASLFIATATQHLCLADSPSALSPDGWTTFDLDVNPLSPFVGGPFHLQVRCPGCKCCTIEEDKTPFLHLQVHPRGPVRSPRHAIVPWSPAAVDLLRRPSAERLSDCQRAEVEVSFQELEWDNWIVHPKTVTFSYCQGNCSSSERMASLLGVVQCCAPVPGSMRSLRITTTSDGGYSFKYETLPNIMPEECACT